MTLFIQHLSSDPLFFFSWSVAVIFSICFHEYWHAAAAYRLGDDTAARSGHLSLNPMVQMGAASIIMLLLIGIAWGSVPVDPRRLRTPASRALVSAAGPLANLFLCAVFGILAGVGMAFSAGAHASGSTWHMLSYFLTVASSANGVLLVLNLLPLPMLDGSAVLAAVWPAWRRLSPEQAQLISMIALVLLFFTPAGSLIWTAGYALGHFFIALPGVLLSP